MPFQDYVTSGLVGDLLPIIPPDAVVSVSSRHPEHVRQSRGKVPGRRLDDGWCGYAAWPTVEATIGDLNRWDGWSAGVGLQGRRVIGIDIDVSDTVLADRIEVAASSILGFAPARFAGGARRLCPYRLVGATKRRLGFSLPRRSDGAAEALSADGLRLEGAADRASLDPRTDAHAVELLATGQQFLLEGMHPSGMPYSWRGGVSLVTLGLDGLTHVTPDQLDQFFNEVAQLVTSAGGMIITRQAHARSLGSGIDASHFAPSVEAVERALAHIPNTLSYDDWITVGMAVKAALGDDGFDPWVGWSLTWAQNTPEEIEAKWDSFKPPFRVGWQYLAKLASEHGFSAAREEFGYAGDPPREDDGTDDADRAQAKATGNMFLRAVYVESMDVAFDLATLRLQSRGQFNAHWWTVGDPTDSRRSAWAVFTQQGGQRRNVTSLTYRPGGKLFVDEPGIGMCVNIWRAPSRPPAVFANDDDVKLWLDHIAYLVPDKREREILLNWLAYIVQHPELKPNYGLVLGSQHQGVGKSIMLQPVRWALGEHNVREIGPEELQSSYNGWLANTKLLIVEEMHSFERKSLMNRLKSFMATPPWLLQVNPKYGKPFEIPNLIAAVFFTNHRDALALDDYDRRFLILWCEEEPREPRYYKDLMLWYEAGGAARVARWLLDRDLSGFDAQGRAPATEAKTDMRNSSRSLVEEWIEEGFFDARGVFAPDVVTVKDVADAIPDRVVGRDRRLTNHKIAAILRRLGGVNLGRPIVDGDRVTAFALRNAHAYRKLSLEMLAARILRLRAAKPREQSNGTAKDDFSNL